MPTYTLYYLPMKSRAEFIRYMFNYAQVEFTDVRIGRLSDEWKKMKSNTQFGFMPILEEDGKQLSQSLAIGRHLARVFGLDGKTEWDKSLADMYCDGVQELITSTKPIFIAYFKESPERSKEVYQNMKQETMLPMLARYEGFLKSSGTGYYCSELTWADFMCAEWFEKYFMFDETLAKDFPLIAAHIQKINDIPQIKQYRETRPKTTF